MLFLVCLRFWSLSLAFECCLLVFLWIFSSAQLSVFFCFFLLIFSYCMFISRLLFDWFLLNMCCIFLCSFHFDFLENLKIFLLVAAKLLRIATMSLQYTTYLGNQSVVHATKDKNNFCIGFVFFDIYYFLFTLSSFFLFYNK